MHLPIFVLAKRQNQDFNFKIDVDAKSLALIQNRLSFDLADILYIQRAELHSTTAKIGKEYIYTINNWIKNILKASI
jgi:hypothetical protein